MQCVVIIGPFDLNNQYTNFSSKNVIIIISQDFRLLLAEALHHRIKATLDIPERLHENTDFILLHFADSYPATAS